jgi:hypothetical protein
LLHSFEFGRARRAFKAASSVAPDFAMAYWVGNDARPSYLGEQDQKAGLAALASTRTYAGRTPCQAPTLRRKDVSRRRRGTLW